MLETVVPHLALTTGASMGQPNLFLGLPCGAADQARIALAARLSRTTDRRKRFPLRRFPQKSPIVKLLTEFV